MWTWINNDMPLMKIEEEKQDSQRFKNMYQNFGPFFEKLKDVSLELPPPHPSLHVVGGP
jgi:hypothetical protein